MELKISSASIINLQNQAIEHWKNNNDETLQAFDFYSLVLENHHFNFSLWNTEDKARRDDMGYEYVYQAKRQIDGFNQQRNNRMEAIDTWLVNQLQPSSDSACPVHSETPGMMIDRLSILALKIYHMRLQTLRADVDDLHLKTCQSKLDVLLQQQKQLGLCLDQLLAEVLAGTRTFKVYYQMKMYNDPKLNPQLYMHKS